MTASIIPIQPIAGLDADAMQALVTGGDCSRLSPAQQTAYYIARCEAAGLDPRAQPFQFVRLQGGLKLYATKAATDQLTAKHRIAVEVMSQTTEAGIRTVTVRAKAQDGRQTDEIGAVPVEGLKGEALANAYMKAVTKAKRRAVLSICGLGLLDETEIESIPGAAPVQHQEVAVEQPAPTPPPAPRQQQSAGVMARRMALWVRLKQAHGEEKQAKAPASEAALRAAAEKAGVPGESKSWTAEQLDLVERELFPPGEPDDIQF